VIFVCGLHVPGVWGPFCGLVEFGGGGDVSELVPDSGAICKAAAFYIVGVTRSKISL